MVRVHGGWTAFAFALVASVGFVSCQGGGSGGGGGKTKTKPELYLVIPTVGAITGGTRVTLFTRNFDDNFLVNFPDVLVDGVPATNVTPATPVEVYADIPVGGTFGPVDIVLTSTGIVQSATCKNCFEYVPPPTCTITGVQKKVPGGTATAQGDVAGGDTAIIFGDGFGDAGDPQTEVFFSTEKSPFVLRISPQELEATVPAAAGGIPGFADIIVQTAAGASCSFPGGWEYTVTQCAITAASPSTGPVTGGETISITGSDFDPLATVLFGADPATNITVSMAGDVITCDTPAVANPGKVTITINNVTHTCQLIDGYEFLPVGGCTIDSVLPAGGNIFGGTQITISGAMFEGGPPIPEVEIGGNPATNEAWVDDTTITCRVPGAASAGKVDVLVRNRVSGLTCTLPNGYEYLDPGVCGVYSTEPPTGPTFGGNTVTLHGAGFVDPPDALVFGSQSIDVMDPTKFTYIDSFTVTVTAPAAVNPGPVDVTYVNPGPSPCVLTGGYEYKIPVTGCAISAVTPNQGPRTGGTWLTIDGMDFNEEVNGGVRVFFGKPPSDYNQANPYFTIVTGTTVVDTITPGTLTPRVEDVLVIGESSNSTCTLVDGFTYLSGCTITSISPPSGAMTGGETVTILGNLFDPAGDVRFGDNFSPSVTVISPNQIEAVTPPSQVSGPVDVRILGSQAVQCASVGGYTYQAGPGGGGCTVTAVVPGNGSPLGGDAVQISGTGFDAGPPVAGVLFGLNPATNVTVVSPNLITCISPNALYSGEVDVTVVNANGDACTLPLAFLYDPLPTCDTACVISSVMPNQGQLLGGNSTSIQGDGFCQGAKVFIGNNQAPVTMFSTTNLFVRVPQGDAVGTAHVWILNPNGQLCVMVDAYTYTP